jgi:hypothetical protein
MENQSRGVPSAASHSSRVHFRTDVHIQGRGAQWRAAHEGPILIFLAVVLVAGSGLAIMNNACKSGYRTWCAPTSGIRHHLKARHSSNAGGAVLSFARRQAL